MPGGGKVFRTVEKRARSGSRAHSFGSQPIGGGSTKISTNASAKITVSVGLLSTEEARALSGTPNRRKSFRPNGTRNLLGSPTNLILMFFLPNGSETTDDELQTGYRTLQRFSLDEQQRGNAYHTRDNAPQPWVLVITMTPPLRRLRISVRRDHTSPYITPTSTPHPHLLGAIRFDHNLTQRL